MFDELIDKLLGRSTRRGTVAGLFLRRAVVDARAAGHSEVDVEHVLLGLVRLIDVKKMLAPRGISADDVEAILEQLLAERRTSEKLGPEPPLSARLKTVCDRSVVGEWIALRAFLENLAAALPRELGFARASLTATAPEIAAFFDAPLSKTPDGHLTFTAWSPQMAGIAGLMQRLSDGKLKGWAMSIHTFFVSLLGNKAIHAAFKARGIDTVAILKEVGDALMKTYGRVTFEPPEDHVPSISPGLYALFIRAEQYAADDRSQVTLQHVLAALHDEPEYADAVDKLAG